MTYRPSSVIVTRGSSQPPSHSYSFILSLSGYMTGSSGVSCGYRLRILLIRYAKYVCRFLLQNCPQPGKGHIFYRLYGCCGIKHIALFPSYFFVLHGTVELIGRIGVMIGLAFSGLTKPPKAQSGNTFWLYPNRGRTARLMSKILFHALKNKKGTEIQTKGYLCQRLFIVQSFL